VAVAWRQRFGSSVYERPRSATVIWQPVVKPTLSEKTVARLDWFGMAEQRGVGFLARG